MITEFKKFTEAYANRALAVPNASPTCVSLRDPRPGSGG